MPDAAPGDAPRSDALKVVITRPLAQAQAFAPQVAALGLTPVIFPLLDIAPLTDTTELLSILARLTDYALVVFVSPNAIDATFRLLQQPWPATVTIGIVGAGSRHALAQHGVDDRNCRIVAPADPEKTDSEGLFAALDQTALRGKRVLIVRGQAGRDFLTDALTGIGVTVEHVSAYMRGMPVVDATLLADLTQLIDGNCVWIVTSSEALRNLLSMAGQTGVAGAVAKLQQQRIVVPHARIAETARHSGFCSVGLTGSGDERLLAALQSCR